MPLIKETIAGFYNGVSQQANELRLKTQVSEMINAEPSLTYGVQKRAPTQSVGMKENIGKNSFIYTYDRGLTGSDKESYTIIIDNKEIKVFDKDFKKRVVKYVGNSKEYLKTNLNSSVSFSGVTVKDYTFIVNKTKTVKMTKDLTYHGDKNYHKKYALYWIKTTRELRYGKELEKTKGYDYTLQGTTINGTSSMEIIKQFKNKLPNCYISESILKQDNLDVNAPWTWGDSYGNLASFGWKGVVQKMEDLPAKISFKDILVNVAGDSSNSFSQYWLVSDGNKWEETTSPAIPYKIDKETMPHALIRQADGTFTFEPIEWEDRGVGDENTAKTPSFIDNKISDIFLFKNRLGFISNDNVILSETGEYYNFFPTTVIDIIDTDPIDVAVDTNRSVNLSYALTIQDSLIIFSDKAQFILKGGDTLSIKTVSVTQTTAYDFNSYCEPKVLGSNVYFTLNTQSYSSVMEYYTQTDSLINEASRISETIPSYIPKDISKLVGSSHLNKMFILSPINPNTIYYYKYYWEGNKKVQTSWSKWVFDGYVSNIYILDSYLYLLIDRGNGIGLERINLEAVPFKDRVYLDNGLISYDMELKLSKWQVRTGESIADPIGNLRLRTLTLTSEDDSQFNLKILNGTRKREYLAENIKDKKILLLGDSKNVDISIICKDSVGCQLNTIAYEGTYTSRSRSIYTKSNKG